jgi:hypothetical protein
VEINVGISSVHTTDNQYDVQHQKKESSTEKLYSQNNTKTKKWRVNIMPMVQYKIYFNQMV